MTAMWSHYCPAEKTVIETGDGEPCNWCGSQSLKQAGTVVFDTTLSKLAVYSGAAWQTITSV